MIDGITVLAESASKIPWWQALLMAIVTAIIAGFMVGLVDKNMLSGIIAGLIALFLTYGLICIANREASPTYKVLIDDTVSMKEFDELYEIVGHDGDIVIIKMKEKKE